MRTIIPAKHGRPTLKPARGHYRRLMQTRFDHTAYAQRAQVETTISMLKRRQGNFVAARRYWSQGRELLWKALAHNIMVLFLLRVFYRAGLASIGRLGKQFATGNASFIAKGGETTLQAHCQERLPAGLKRPANETSATSEINETKMGKMAGWLIS